MIGIHMGVDDRSIVHFVIDQGAFVIDSLTNFWSEFERIGLLHLNSSFHNRLEDCNVMSIVT